MSSWLRSIPLLSGIVVFFGVAVYLQNDLAVEGFTQGGAYRGSLYLPEPEYVQRLAVGYDHFLADFLWLRSIQAFGAYFDTLAEVDQVITFYDVITDLDPHFIAPYVFGNMVIGEEAGDFEGAYALLDKGIEHNPDTYILAYEAAFIALWLEEDGERARKYVRLAVAAPDCPEHVKGWENYIDRKMGRFLAAYEKNFIDYCKYYNRGNADFSSIYYRRLRFTLEDWYVAELRTKAIEYREDHGGVNPSIEQLNEAGAFRDAEWPDWERLGPFLDAMAENNEPFPDSQEEVLVLARRFIRTGWERIPPNPASDFPDFPGFIVWPGMDPWRTVRGRDGAEERQPNDSFALSEEKAAINVRDEMARNFPMTLRAYQQAHDGECPPSLDVLGANLTRVPGPWGGKWIWDPYKCEVRNEKWTLQEIEEKLGIASR